MSYQIRGCHYNSDGKRLKFMAKISVQHETLGVHSFAASDAVAELVRLAVSNYGFLLKYQEKKDWSFSEFADQIGIHYSLETPENAMVVNALREAQVVTDRMEEAISTIEEMPKEDVLNKLIQYIKHGNWDDMSAEKVRDELFLAYRKGLIAKEQIDAPAYV